MPKITHVMVHLMNYTILYTIYTVFLAPCKNVPLELYSQVCHRRLWWSLHSESLLCTSQSQPVYNGLLHLEEYCPVSGPWNKKTKNYIDFQILSMHSWIWTNYKTSKQVVSQTSLSVWPLRTHLLNRSQ